MMTKAKKQHQKYDQLDAILDFAYGSGARRNASRARNTAIAKLVKKVPVANDAQITDDQAA